MKVRRLVAAVAAVTSVVGVAVSADAAVNPPQVLLDTFMAPTGLAVDKSGALIIAQDDYPLFTPSPSITKVPLVGPQRLQAIPLSNQHVPYDVAVNPTNGRPWIIDRLTGHVMRQRVDGSFVTVIDMHAYQAGDPDPVAQPQPQQIGDVGEPPTNPTKSFPAALAFRSNGELLVVDQFNNDLVLVRPNGTARTIARFDTELLPAPEVLAILSDYIVTPEMETEAAPAAVFIGRDGAVYVGEQKGFPYPEDTARVWRIDPSVLNGTRPAWCSVKVPDARCKVFASGFTGIVDIAEAPTSRPGQIYVLEHAEPLYIPLLHGQAGPLSGRLIRASRSNQITVPTVALIEPRDIVVMSGGAIYLTDWGETSGRLSKNWD